MSSRLLRVIIVVVLFAMWSIHAVAQETQIFTTEDETFTFEYPAGWMAEVINADQGPNAHLSVDNLPLEERFDSPEGVNLQISLPRKSYELSLMGGKTPAEMVAASVRTVVPVATIEFATPSADGTPQPFELTPGVPGVSEFLIDGRPAAYAYNVMQVMDRDASHLMIVADLGNDYWVSIMVSSFQGGLDTLQRNEAVILEIVKSMRYTPPTVVYSGNPSLPNVFSGVVGIWQRGSIEFYYPEDWYASNTIFVFLSNKAGNVLNTSPESGQFIAAVQGVSETRASADQTELFNQCNTTGSDWTARKLVAAMLGKITSDQLEQLNEAGITMTQPEVVTINNVEIVYIRQYQDDIEALNMFVDLGDGNIPSMVVTAVKGEMARFEDQLFAVASTFRYTPRPCEETESGD